jgi:immune inhibitor A
MCINIPVLSDCLSTNLLFLPSTPSSLQQDAFVVVHAGPAAESLVSGQGSNLWSLKSVLNDGAFITRDGVQVYSFLTISEDCLLGVAAHELGHLVFGW